MALAALAFAVGVIRASAGSLPIVASAQAATPSATETGSPARDPVVVPLASVSAPGAKPPSRLRLGGEKWSAPHLQRSEAGVAWSVLPRVTLELNYERSALGPTMRHDHDDGILTRLKLGF